MKVYTVHYQVKDCYDFSVEQTNHGCFRNETDAINALKNVVSTIKEIYAYEIEKYSDKEKYPDEYSGGLYIEEDDNIFYMSFGCCEHSKSHTVWFDEWEVK